MKKTEKRSLTMLLALFMTLGILLPAAEARAVQDPESGYDGGEPFAFGEEPEGNAASIEDEEQRNPEDALPQSSADGIDDAEAADMAAVERETADMGDPLKEHPADPSLEETAPPQEAEPALEEAADAPVTEAVEEAEPAPAASAETDDAAPEEPESAAKGETAAPVEEAPEEAAPVVEETSKDTAMVGETAEEANEEAAEEAAEGVAFADPAEKTLPIQGDTADPDTLFAGFVDSEMRGRSLRPGLRKSAGAGNGLTGEAKALYDLVSAAVVEIAEGRRASTRLEFTTEELGLGESIRWTKEDLGVESVLDEDGHIVDELWDKFLEVFRTDLLYSAINDDHPYAFYWSDKTRWLSYGVSNCRVGSEQEWVEFSLVRVTFYVMPEYADGNETTMKTEVGETVLTAAQNARDIVAAYAGGSDWEKLHGYRLEICRLVNYNYDAAEESEQDSISSSNPWQIIWAFDGDPETNIVCEGYAKAFQHLCDLSTFRDEIRCISVTGDAGGGHMWNVVRMGDGKSYLADVTWCDNSGEGSDWQFLMGYDSGSFPTYTVNSGTYTYDSDSIALYGEEILTLGDEDYDPTAEATLSGISLSALPGKTEYIVGEALDLDGGVLRLSFDNGSTEEIPLTAEMISGYDSGVIGIQTLTVSYGGFTTDLQVTVRERRLIRIVITVRPGKTEYFIGERLELEGCRLTLVYEDYSTEEIPLTEDLTSGYDSGVIGTQTVTVSYGGFTDSFAVTVREKALTSIALSAQPEKREYLVGEALDLSGGMLTLTYEDYTTEEIPLTAEMVTGYDSSVIGAQTLTVSYGGFTDSFVVTVRKAPETSGICGENLTWALDETGTLTVSGTGEMWDMVQEGDLCDYHPCPWEESKNCIQAVVLCEGVTSVGAGAFSSCEPLLSVSFPRSLREIRYIAFFCCTSLNDAPLNDGLEVLGQQAFANCALTEVTIPASVRWLDATYQGSPRLETVTIEGDPDLDSFGCASGMFAFCPALRRIDVTGDHISLRSVDGVLYDKFGTLVQYPFGRPDTVYRVEDGTKTMYRFSMAGNTALKTLILPDSIEFVDILWTEQDAIVFEGPCPAFEADALESGHPMTVYYPNSEPSWTAEARQSYGGQQVSWAAYGWKQEGSAWKWEDPWGNPKTGWLKTNGQFYYLDASGAMQTGWLKSGGSWYYLDSRMVTGWYKVNDGWYFFNDSGAMQTGWLKSGDSWYYLDSRMVTGWYKVGESWYFFNDSGAMQTGWLKSGESWYYMDSRMVTGWYKVNDSWYYFNGSGAMQTGWLKSGGNWYYQGPGGRMVTGWYKVGDSWYWFEDSGRMVSGTTLTIGGKQYSFDGSGRWIS